MPKNNAESVYAPFASRRAIKLGIGLAALAAVYFGYDNMTSGDEIMPRRGHTDVVRVNGAPYIESPYSSQLKLNRDKCHGGPGSPSRARTPNYCGSAPTFIDPTPEGSYLYDYPDVYSDDAYWEGDGMPCPPFNELTNREDIIDCRREYISGERRGNVKVAPHGDVKTSPYSGEGGPHEGPSSTLKVQGRSDRFRPIP